MGMGGDKVLPKLVDGLTKESGPGKDISKSRTKLFLESYAPALRPAPGSRNLVKRLQKDGYKLVIASSANEEDLETLLKAAQVNDLVEHATTSSDVNSSKPEPDIVHAALEKISLSAHEALMIGDTPYDLEAATKAGVELIAVRCGGWKDKNLKGARAIYDSPVDLLDHYDMSPLSKSFLD